MAHAGVEENKEDLIMRCMISAVAFLLCFVGLLSVAQSAGQKQDQVDLLEKATAVVDEHGRHGIPEALELIEKAIAINPASELPYIASARIFLLKAEIDKEPAGLQKALEYVDKAIKINPLNADARTCKAQVLLDKKSNSEALFELQKALEADPANLNANITFMALLIRSGQRKQAAVFAGESLDKVDDKSAVARTYGKLMLGAGYWEEALKMFEQAAAGGPTRDPEILKGSALAFSKLGRFPGAANVYTLAYAAEPENKQLLVHISICYEKAGELEKSAEYLKQYVSLFPRDTSALRKLAGLYDKLGEKNAAGEIRNNLKGLERRNK